MSYYSDEVAGGLEDYYAGRGEAAGTWVGQGAAAAGLNGDVSAEQLARLFKAEHPDTGEVLGAGYKVRAGADRVTGWDLTFSAPKSLSVLWALGGGEVGMVARECHDAAVVTALEYLEEHAAFSRQGKAGIRQVDTEGLVGAAFVHRTSRAGDPQLHTHVLVCGRVRYEDGVWRALDSRALHRELKPGGTVYHAALRAESEARLGVAWGPVDRNGQADIVGVPEELVSHYSKRRRALEVVAKAKIAESEVVLGRSLTPEEHRRAYQRATLETRVAKSLPRSLMRVCTTVGGQTPTTPGSQPKIGSPTRFVVDFSIENQHLWIIETQSRPLSSTTWWPSAWPSWAGRPPPGAGAKSSYR